LHKSPFKLGYVFVKKQQLRSTVQRFMNVLSELVNILRMERQQGQKERWSASLTDMSNGDGPTPRPWLTSSFLDSTANISLYLIVVNVLGTSSNSGVKEKLSCMPRDPVFYYNLSGSCAGGNKILIRILYNVLLLLFMIFTATCTMLCHHLAFLYIYNCTHKPSSPCRTAFHKGIRSTQTKI
jgi:hypothetical protein